MAVEKIKYLVYQDFLLAEVPTVFPDCIQHRDMGNRLGLVRDKIISAGFAVLTKDGWRAYGESVSLRLKSRETEDTNLLNAFYPLSPD